MQKVHGTSNRKSFVSLERFLMVVAVGMFCILNWLRLLPCEVKLKPKDSNLDTGNLHLLV